jgi:hypothetical protein
LREHANPILFADDTSVIISSPDMNEFENKVNLVINIIVNWCKTNSLTLNIEKTQFMQFYTNHHKKLDLQILVNDLIVTNATNIRFLGLQLDNKLTWNAYSHELKTKLNKACYAIRAIKPLVSQNVLITIYYSYFHSVLKYGVMFWGSSAITGDIFKVQKRAIRIITNRCRRESCRPLFKHLKILTVFSQYIFSVLVFMTNNMNLFIFNREIHSINTRSSLDLHLQATNLSIVQKGVLHSGCKIFNSLPLYIKTHLENSRHFKKILKNYLIEHSLYSLDEFYHVTKS